MNNLSQTSLAFHNAVRNVEAATQSGQEENDLNRVNIVSNNDQTSLLVFNQLGNIVDTKTDTRWALGYSLGLTLLAFFGTLLQTLFLGLSGFRTVLIEQIEDLSS